VKINMGCGHRKQAGYLNVDLSPACEPDLVLDMETLPWPWADDSVDEVLFNHSLEHAGAQTSVFLGIIRELYRVCRPGAVVLINVPHPRHDFFLDDPTHVRAITPQSLALFDRQLNDEWKRTGSSAATPLAHYLGVDFRIVHTTFVLDEPYASRYAKGEITADALATFARERNNVVCEYNIQLEVRK